MVTWNTILYYICLQSECKHSQSILWSWEAASFLQWSCVNSKPPLYINESFLFNWGQCFQGRQHSEVSEVSLYCSTILTGSPPPRGQSSCSLPWFSHVFCCLAEVSHCSATSRTVKHLCLSTRWCYLSLSYSISYFSKLGFLLEHTLWVARSSFPFCSVFNHTLPNFQAQRRSHFTRAATFSQLSMEWLWKVPWKWIICNFMTYKNTDIYCPISLWFHFSHSCLNKKVNGSP